MKIAAVCGSFHKKEIELMLEYALDEAKKHSIEISEVVWVPGSMEVPLALNRVIADYDAAICLGIIEKGETSHGLAMGQAVIKTLVDLQLGYDKPVGLGIIGPGAEVHHIPPRLEPHARNAISAINAMI